MGLVEERAFGVEDKRVAEVAEQEAIFFFVFLYQSKSLKLHSLTHSLCVGLGLGSLV